jgi:hypothetical protein
MKKGFVAYGMGKFTPHRHGKLTPIEIGTNVLAKNHSLFKMF